MRMTFPVQLSLHNSDCFCHDTKGRLVTEAGTGFEVPVYTQRQTNTGKTKQKNHARTLNYAGLLKHKQTKSLKLRKSTHADQAGGSGDSASLEKKRSIG